MDRGRRRAPLPGRDGRPLVLQRRPRPDRDRRGGRGPAVEPGVLFELRRSCDRADPGAGRSPGRPRADGGRVCLLRLRWLRRGRHRGQARPALLGRPRPHGEEDRRQPGARLPRHARLRDGPGRDPAQPRGLRRPDRRRHDPGLGPRRRGAGTALSGPWQGDRRLHRRAGDRCRRRHPARGRLLGGGDAPLRRPRRAAGGGRGHHGVRAPRHHVRERALRDRAGHDLLRQGRHLRLPAARRGARRAPRRRAVLGRPGGPDLPPRLHLLGACHGLRGGPRQPRHPGAGGPARPGASAGAGPRPRDRSPGRGAARRRDAGRRPDGGRGAGRGRAGRGPGRAGGRGGGAPPARDPDPRPARRRPPGIATPRHHRG